MIAIVDYGMGNLRSVQKAFQYIGAETKITQNPEEIINAEKIVLPGVGAFKVAMQRLESLGLVSVLKNLLKKDKPYLGICLGLQILFDESDEGDKVRGLGILSGKVRKFSRLKIPHMGWNQIKFIRLRQGFGACLPVRQGYPQKSQTKVGKNKSLCFLFKDIPDNSFMYFCHSYFVVPRDENIVVASTDYGVDFASAVSKDNVVGVQFHPEKSQKLGIKILENFVNM